MRGRQQTLGRKAVDTRVFLQKAARAVGGQRHLLAGSDNDVRLLRGEERKRLTRVLRGDALHAIDGHACRQRVGEKGSFERGLGGVKRHVGHQGNALDRAVGEAAAGDIAGDGLHIKPSADAAGRRAAQREDEIDPSAEKQLIPLQGVGKAADNHGAARAGGEHILDGAVFCRRDVIRQPEEDAVTVFGGGLTERAIQIVVNRAAHIRQNDGQNERAAAAQRGGGFVDAVAHGLGGIHDQLDLLSAHIALVVEHVGDGRMGNADGAGDIFDGRHNSPPFVTAFFCILLYRVF